MSKLTIHGIHMDGKEICSGCGNALIVEWDPDTFSPYLHCNTCSLSTITVDYEYEKNMQERKHQWLAKYPALAYYSNMPSNMNRVSGYCMGGVTGKLEMPKEYHE